MGRSYFTVAQIRSCSFYYFSFCFPCYLFSSYFYGLAWRCLEWVYEAIKGISDKNKGNVSRGWSAAISSFMRRVMSRVSYSAAGGRAVALNIHRTRALESWLVHLPLTKKCCIEKSQQKLKKSNIHAAYLSNIWTFLHFNKAIDKKDLKITPAQGPSHALTGDWHHWWRLTIRAPAGTRRTFNLITS